MRDDEHDHPGTERVHQRERHNYCLAKLDLHDNIYSGHGPETYRIRSEGLCGRHDELLRRVGGYLKFGGAAVYEQGRFGVCV